MGKVGGVGYDGPAVGLGVGDVGAGDGFAVGDVGPGVGRVGLNVVVG